MGIKTSRYWIIYVVCSYVLNFVLLRLLCFIMPIKDDVDRTTVGLLFMLSPVSWWFPIALLILMSLFKLINILGGFFG